LATLLDQARREGRVQIGRQDGSTFVVEPVVSDRSPLDVPDVRTRLRRGELEKMVREERQLAGDRVLTALSDRRLQLPRARQASKRPRRRPARPRS
jgi:hypothetical protein